MAKVSAFDTCWELYWSLVVSRRAVWSNHGPMLFTIQPVTKPPVLYRRSLLTSWSAHLRLVVAYTTLKIAYTACCLEGLGNLAPPVSSLHANTYKLDCGECYVYTECGTVYSLDFLARDSIYAIARYMPSPVRPSVCLSHGWISQRRLKLGSRNLHHRLAP